MGVKIIRLLNISVLAKLMQQIIGGFYLPVKRNLEE